MSRLVEQPPVYSYWTGRHENVAASHRHNVMQSQDASRHMIPCMLLWGCSGIIMPQGSAEDPAGRQNNTTHEIPNWHIGSPSANTVKRASRPCQSLPWSDTYDATPAAYRYAALTRSHAVTHKQPEGLPTQVLQHTQHKPKSFSTESCVHHPHNISQPAELYWTTPSSTHTAEESLLVSRIRSLPLNSN